MLAVLLHHAMAYVGSPTQRWSGSTEAGFLALPAFFVLSGLVIAWSYDEWGSRPGTILRQRLGRIAANQMIVWLVLLVLGYCLPAVFPRPLGHAAKVLGLFLLQPWSLDQHVVLGVNPPSWSLGCEVLYYPASFWVLARRPGCVTARKCAVVGAAVLGTDVVLSWLFAGSSELAVGLLANPFQRLPEFAAGLVAGKALRAGWRPSAQPRLVQLAGLGLAALVVVETIGACLTPHGVLDVVPRWTANLAVAGPLSLMLAAAAERDVVTPRLSASRSSRATRWVGQRALSIYLVHYGCLTLSAWLLPRAHVPTGAGALAWLIVAVGLSLLVGDRYHSRVESPLHRVLRRRTTPSRPVAVGSAVLEIA